MKSQQGNNLKKVSVCLEREEDVFDDVQSEPVIQTCMFEPKKDDVRTAVMCPVKILLMRRMNIMMNSRS